MNVNGQTEFSSWPGALMTIFLYLTLAAYAYQRFNKLIFRENPDIQTAVLENEFDKDYTVTLNDIDFKIAFGVNDYKNGKPYDDPNYVKWVVHMNDYENQRYVNKNDVGFHKCTDEDYDSIYPPGPNDVDAINTIRTQNYSLYCINSEDLITIYGRNNFHYRRFEIMYMACTPDPENNICMDNHTFEETLDYLGPIPDIYILQN